MKLSRYSKSGRNFLLLLLLFVVCFPLAAKPIVDRASLRYGFSPRIKRYSWGVLGCRIQNPDSKAYNVEIRFVDATRGAINHKTVFADTVYIPPKTVIHYKTPVMTEDAEEYSLEIFVDGKQQKKVDSFIISLISGTSSYLVILNDSDDVSLGAFATSPEFKGQYALSNFMARNPPAPWTLIKKAACVVIVRPDYSKYSTEAYQAVLDYVQQGGNVIFADPQGAMEASKTPLSVLLPVSPIRFRKVTTMDPMSKLFPEFKSFKKPVDFLEAAPLGDGVNFLEQGGMPVFRWKKFGLGTCRFSAVPITSDAYATSDVWRKVLAFFLANQVISNNLSTAVPALDEMTGFSVPGIDKVRNIFFIYFLLMIIPLGLGIFLKRTGLAWMITGVITVCFAVFILKYAASSHSKQSGTFLSFIETAVPGITASPGEGWYGIFSTSDAEITIKAENEQTTLSAVPPPDNIMAMFKNAANKGGLGARSFTTPTEVKGKNALREIHNLKLNSNASRQFYASYNAIDAGSFNSPVLKYKKDGYELEKWTVPEGMKPYAAWLQFANGIIPLVVNNNQVSMSSASGGMFSSDTTLLSVQNFMLKGWKHSSPIMVLVENSEKTHLDLPKDITAHGKKITAVPVTEVSEETTITVPAESVLMTAGDTSTRLVMNGNEIKKDIVSRSDSDYVFRYQLPPVFAGMKAEKIELDFKYLNDGGNVEVKPVLVVGQILDKKFVPKQTGQAKNKPASQPKKKRRKKRHRKSAMKESRIVGIQGKKEGNTYVFNDVKDCLRNGTGFIALKIKIKRKNLPMGERLRANKWSLEKFGIKVTGAIPESAPPFKF